MINVNYIKTYVTQLRKPKVLFVWIPKNAGTSIYESLNKTLGMKMYLNVENINKEFTNNGLVTFGHINVQELLKNNIISNSYYNNAIKFCVSRNPYDRFVSLFHYLKRQNRIPDSYKYSDLIGDVIKGIPSVGLYNFKGISQCNKQVDWVDDIEINTIIRFENLYKEFNSFSEKFKVGINLTHKNKSLNRKKNNMDLDNKTIKLIKEYYEPDFYRFNYSMDIE